MKTDDTAHKIWQSISPGTRGMLVPSATNAEPDALDLSRRNQVFSGNNYQVSPEFKEWIASAKLGISRATARDAVIKAIHAFAGQPVIPQRSFVLALMDLLVESLPPQVIASLEQISVKRYYPKTAGLVALAIGIKEAAKRAEVGKCDPCKNGILSIRSGEIVPVTPAGELREDEEARWLGLE